MSKTLAAIDFKEPFFDQDITLEISQNQKYPEGQTSPYFGDSVNINVVLWPNPDAAYSIDSEEGKMVLIGKKKVRTITETILFACGKLESSLQYYPAEGEKIEWKWKGGDPSIIPTFDKKKN